MGMLDSSGKIVELYIPQKCSWTGKLITANDRTAIQIGIGFLGSRWCYFGNKKFFTIAGSVRTAGESDLALDTLFSTHFNRRHVISKTHIIKSTTKSISDRE